MKLRRHRLNVVIPFLMLFGTSSVGVLWLSSCDTESDTTTRGGENITDAARDTGKASPDQESADAVSDAQVSGQDGSGSSDSSTDLQGAFSVYLLKDTALTANGLGQDDLDSLQLQDEPLLTESDISYYAWSTHALILANGSAVSFPKPPVYGTPFVVVSHGQRQYLGALWTAISSVLGSVPTIMVDHWITGITGARRIYLIEWPFVSFQHEGTT